MLATADVRAAAAGTGWDLTGGGSSRHAVSVAETEPDTVRRLAYIRLLLARAIEESRLSAPYSFDSVNRLHDVAEMFLALATQKYELKVPKEFIGYWPLLEGALGRPLGYRVQAERFNKVRVAWKHYGAEPAVAEIEAARTTIAALLEGETKALFGIELADVSLTNFVKPGTARDLVANAEKLWMSTEEQNAFGDLAEAFDVMISDYIERRQVGHASSLLSATPDYTFAKPRGLEHELSRLFDELVDGIKAVDTTAVMIGVGIDLRRLSRFRSLTPRVTRYAMGHRGTHEPARRTARSDEEFNRCRDFIIDTAITLAAFDFEMDADNYVRGEYVIRRKQPGQPLVKAEDV